MLHSWDLSPGQAVELQKKLHGRLREDLFSGEVRQVAGVDVAYLKDLGLSVAAVCVLSYPELELVESASHAMETPFPYIPGLLSFREIPPVLKAWEKLSSSPDLVLVDGHGQAHPRRMGIASHLGLWLEKPTIGIGKSKLCGDYCEPAPQRGSSSALEFRNEIVAEVLRTRDGVRPIFVSVGHGLRLADCLVWTLRLTPRFRLPEPIRLADKLAARQKASLARGS